MSSLKAGFYLLLTKKKNKRNLKVENYVLFGRLEAASQIALRDCSKDVREGPGYIGVFATKTR